LTVDLNLVNTKMLIPLGIIEGGIAIDEGKIVKIAKTPNLPSSDTTIDLQGKLTLPGLIDAHVHLRDLELSYKEDFTTGTAAAAAGGFTTILDMPNSKPPTDSPSRLREKIDTAETSVLVNTGFYGMIPSQGYQRMAGEGVVAFKIFLNRSTPSLDVESDTSLSNVLTECAKANRPIAVHAEEHAYIRKARERLGPGPHTTEDFLEVYSGEAEVASVARVVKVTKGLQGSIHFCHISQPESLATIRKATGADRRVTSEVTPHHLFLSNSAVRKLGGKALMDPPPRTEAEAGQLWRSLREGLIDILVSDHAPHALEEKEKADIFDVPMGIPGLETTLPLMLTRLNLGEIPLERLVNCMSRRPAEIFGLARKGRLEAGSDGDLTVIDIKKRIKIDSSNFHSKAKYSPFDGIVATGVAVKTVVNGQVIMDEGEITAKPGAGRIVRVGQA